MLETTTHVKKNFCEKAYAKQLSGAGPRKNLKKTLQFSCYNTSFHYSKQGFEYALRKDDGWICESRKKYFCKITLE